jgi:hypothetical protein
MCALSLVTLILGALLTTLFLCVPDGRERTALTGLLMAVTLQSALTVVGTAWQHNYKVYVGTIDAAILVRAAGVGWLAAYVWTGRFLPRR